MTHARTGDLVQTAVAAGDSVLALNVISLEHAEGILLGALHADRPVILQVSENAIRYHDGVGEPLLRACSALIAAHAATAALHLDHVTDPALLELASPELGVSSVMYDASTLPWADNVDRTRWATELLHDRGLWVEAELGAIGGKGGAHTPGVRTDPLEARDYVEATGVDALAVAVGSSHAMTEQTASVDGSLVAAIAAVVPVPLVLHGSSGVPVDGLRAATRAGIRKINVGTALNVAFTGRIREVLTAEPGLTDPRRYLDPARTAVADLVAGLLHDLAGTFH
jgi:fructose-bisphosphate aldolase class II